jgi:hypothetical protein
VRRFFYGALALLFTAPALIAAPHHRHRVVNPPNVPFKVGGLVFLLPATWIAEPPSTPVRAGQWRITPPRTQPGDSAQLVVFYFGQGKGGTIKENVDSWIASVTTPDGQPSGVTAVDHVTLGFKISRVVISGTYAQPVPSPGVPPLPKPNYELAGAAIKNPRGNIYWKLVGPEPLVTASLPLFDQLLDSIQPETP